MICVIGFCAWPCCTIDLLLVLRAGLRVRPALPVILRGGRSRERSDRRRGGEHCYELSWKIPCGLSGNTGDLSDITR